MSKIKKFFSKKKEEAVFKLKISGGLGQGHTLSDQNAETSSTCRKTDANVSLKRKELSNEAKAAATAALERVEKKTSKELGASMTHIKLQAKKEIEMEQRTKNEISSVESNIENTSNIINFACQDVLFRCPFISQEILPEKEWGIKIKNFLYQQLQMETVMTSCWIIRSCNSKEKAEECIKTLTKYLENIIEFPEEEKYLKIRMVNSLFCAKVRYVDGALDFLHASGFREVDLDDEKFLVWSKENIEEGYDLTKLLSVLQNSQPIQLVLDRNIKILLYSQTKHVVLSDDFYQISPEEIKREQQLRAEVVEDTQVLKTKAMREREERRIIRKYKYSLVRIKFPNGFFIQGTFNVNEKLKDVFEFVQSCLQNEALEFQLVASGEGKFTEEEMDKTLYELRLVPNIVFLFNVASETSALNMDRNLIREDLLHLVQSI